MAIARERFELALERIRPAEWEKFENLASAFLASEYKALRTMAAPSGDGGRDSTLFADDDVALVAFQYSVTTNWRGKVTDTVTRLKTSFPHIKSLVYVTNQVIGAQADALKHTFNKDGWFLDILDRSWFLERANTDSNREAAAESLAKREVDPLVATKGMDDELIAIPKGEDAKTALLFLEMQVQDANRSYGLTKASYDALTLAALRDTSTAHRLTRKEVFQRVERFLPHHPFQQVRQRVNSALARLGESIRHRKDNDSFHLNDAKIASVSASMSRVTLLKNAFEADLLDTLNELNNVKVGDPSVFVSAARQVVETYFLRKGEAFAQAAVCAEPHKFDDVTLRSIVIGTTGQPFGLTSGNAISTMVSVVRTVFDTSKEATAAYLSLLLESYTLFAFLAATPDVQRATKDMFGGGEIWLDASVLLPVLAEQAAPEDMRPFTSMFGQAKAASLKLYVTEGVLEELERHINRCKAYVRSNSWEGNVPFLYASYIKFGGKASTFASWAERFIGDIDPVQDLADYMKSNHRIFTESAADHPNVPEPLAAAIREAWQRVHEGRREDGGVVSAQAYRLAAHDAENYLHVLSSRIAQRGKAPLGYSDWWLTLDRRAREIWDMIPDHLRPAVNIGPLLSLDYFVRYLALGPNREKVDFTGSALARVYSDILTEPLPPDLVDLMEGIRAENMDLPELIVQRRIRDRLNSERIREGEIAGADFGDVSDIIRSAY